MFFNPSSTRKIVALTVFCISIFLTFQLLSDDGYHRLRSIVLPEGRVSPEAIQGYQNDTLGIASRIYVLSLPTRADRRQEMEKLRNTLGLRWTYIEAIDSENPIVERILSSVRLMRHASTGFSSFTWPDKLPPLNERISAWSHGFLRPPPTDYDDRSPRQPLVCATQNITTAPYKPALPEYRILTPARVACWYSHVSVIQNIANDFDLRPDNAVIVLEDDVNMERDIHERLRHIWPYLPADWDIVYLGHCWSDESITPALNPHENATSTAIGRTASVTHLHPSINPLCTHAYVLSRTGARRLLFHLRHPMFAYSRSIDKAISWLIENKRMKSFSVVPSVVVQRKAGNSDVMSGTGSQWKDELIDGVFND